MWQLDNEATSASSGSTPAGSEKGTRTTLGEDEAGTTAPPSNVQLCARLYLPSMKRSSGLRRHRMVATYVDMRVSLARVRKSTIEAAAPAILSLRRRDWRRFVSETEGRVRELRQGK